MFLARLGRAAVRRQAGAFKRQPVRNGSNHSHDAHGHGHGHSHGWQPPAGYEPPNGFLFSEKPGRTFKDWEDWELISYLGFGSAFLFAIVGYRNRPDTRITTWAHQEAIRQLAEEGLIVTADE
eukprot:Colp12_sorted_trinity150504_noHs@318